MNILNQNAEQHPSDFSAGRVKNSPTHPSEWPSRQSLLCDIRVEPLSTSEEIQRAGELLDAHHYLGAPNPVGQRLWYAVLDANDHWLGLLLFAAASRRLRHRDEWIGWSDQQRRRLPLVVNNTRFLLLPDKTCPNLGSAVLSRVAARLSGDWMERYGHPVLVVETFVDPQLFRGTSISWRVGRRWGKPKATSASRAIATSHTSGPSCSLHANWCAVHAAAFRRNISNPRWSPSKPPRHRDAPNRALNSKASPPCFASASPSIATANVASIRSTHCSAS